MAGDYSFDLTPLIWIGGFLGVVIVGGIWLGVTLFTSSDIESDKPIVPEKRLVIKNNKVDTIYVYKKP